MVVSLPAAASSSFQPWSSPPASLPLFLRRPLVSPSPPCPVLSLLAMTLLTAGSRAAARLLGAKVSLLRRLPTPHRGRGGLRPSQGSAGGSVEGGRWVALGGGRLRALWSPPFGALFPSGLAWGGGLEGAQLMVVREAPGCGCTRAKRVPARSGRTLDEASTCSCFLCAVCVAITLPSPLDPT